MVRRQPNGWFSQKKNITTGLIPPVQRGVPWQNSTVRVTGIMIRNMLWVLTHVFNALGVRRPRRGRSAAAAGNYATTAFIVIPFEDQELSMLLGRENRAWDENNPDNNEQWYAINDHTLPILRRVANSRRMQFEVEQEEGSDKTFLENFANVTKFDLVIRHYAIGYQNNDGALFPYYNRTRNILKKYINLERYGIFKHFKVENYEHNCVIQALKFYGIDVPFKFGNSLITNGKVKMREFHKLCKIIHRGIRVVYLCPKSGTRQVSLYGSDYVTDDLPYLQLALYQHHYFVNDKQYSSSDLGINNNTRKISAFRLLQKLMDLGCFVGFLDRDLQAIGNYKENCKTYDFPNKFQFLTYASGLVRDMEEYARAKQAKEEEKRKAKELADRLACEKRGKAYYPPRTKTRNDIINVFFDVETLHDTDQPFMICWYISTDPDTKHCLTIKDGVDFMETFINSLPTGAICLAHNLSFDSSFLLKFGEITNLIDPHGMTKSISMKINNKYLSFKDSYSFITKKLCDFKDMFKSLKGLDKDIVPYTVYTTESVLLPHLPLSLAQEDLDARQDIDDRIEENNIKPANNEETMKLFLCQVAIETVLKLRHPGIDIPKQVIEPKLSLYEQFYKNCEKNNLLRENNTCFDHMAYMEFYCHQDVHILKTGYTKFKNDMYDVTVKNLGKDKAIDIDLDRIITLPSFADRYFIAAGCFNGVCELTGKVRDFLQLFVTGGRTMCRNNEKLKCDLFITVLDACSLYPSAMARFAGYPTGPPHILHNTNEWSKIKDDKDKHYFVECVVTSLDIKRAMPLLSVMDESGIRQFSNDMIGKTVYLDKYMLEDFIKFQHGTVRIVRGYFFKGYNNKICSVIRDLYDLRVQYKHNKNPVEQLIKLLMNAGYGKTLQKPIDTKTHVVNRDGWDKFIAKNSQYLMPFKKDKNDTYDVLVFKTSNTILDSFNRVHCGVCVLSMSKRIMNEMVCLSEDLHASGAYEPEMMDRRRDPTNPCILRAVHNPNTLPNDRTQVHNFYTDTDSVHMSVYNLPSLELAYNMKYGRLMCGDKLGQFHPDIDCKGIPKTFNNQLAIQAYYLAKKVYCEYVCDKMMNCTHNLAAKGVSDRCIKCHNDPLDSALGVLNVFARMYNSEEIILDLCKTDVRFVRDHHKQYAKTHSFPRTYSFPKQGTNVNCEANYTFDMAWEDIQINDFCKNKSLCPNNDNACVALGQKKKPSKRMRLH